MCTAILAFAIAGSGAAVAKDKPTVSIAKLKGVGTVLVDAKNHTLYTFVDNGQNVDCTGDCLTMGFQPLMIKQGTKPTAGKGVKGLGVVASGQVTENGFPLFVFTTDKAHQANGQGLTSGNGTWHVPTVKAPKSNNQGGSNAGTGGVSF
jgi:predicted lipoprotein with Yx(FWY)xxD motif